MSPLFILEIKDGEAPRELLRQLISDNTVESHAAEEAIETILMPIILAQLREKAKQIKETNHV